MTREQLLEDYFRVGKTDPTIENRIAWAITDPTNARKVRKRNRQKPLSGLSWTERTFTCSPIRFRVDSDTGCGTFVYVERRKGLLGWEEVPGWEEDPEMASFVETALNKLESRHARQPQQEDPRQPQVRQDEGHSRRQQARSRREGQEDLTARVSVLLFLLAGAFVAVMLLAGKLSKYIFPAIAFCLISGAAFAGTEELDEARGQHRVLLDALIEVESNGDDNAVGDSGQALGALQIWSVYYADAVERYPSVEWPAYETAAHNRIWAERLVVAYWARYATERREADSDEARARIHNGGPNGHRRTSTELYWNRVHEILH